jgi:hypothetical protein
MNIDMKEIVFDLVKINKNLVYLTKQLERNKLKYPLGMTYDKLASDILLVASKEDSERQFKIVRMS